MKLNNLLKKCDFVVKSVSCNIDENNLDVNSVCYDSRRVIKGSCFVAVKGYAVDGHQYIETAVKQGAVVVVVDEERLSDFGHLADQIVLLVSSDNRRALSALSAAFYDKPSHKMQVVGVTGTNGKTSITYMLESVFQHLGVKTGVIGTINYRWPGKEIPAPNTTPESADLQEYLAQMAAAGVELVIMEVSSHGLDLHRVDDIAFDYALFTNLTRDHLDFHHDFEHYFLAKRKLFSLLSNSPKEKKAAIINADDQFGQKLLNDEKLEIPLFGYGIQEKTNYTVFAEDVASSLAGIKYRVNHHNSSASVDLQLAGNFNVYNSLAVFSVCSVMGFADEKIIAGLKKLPVVPGRFDRLIAPSQYYVVIDYAHTNDALEKLLASIKQLPHNRIITVFGCGGDRDKTKRPMMGQAAEKYSDLIFVTSDNPRTENPDAILRDIVAGMSSHKYKVEVNREEAIKHALQIAQKDDVVVIAGKGHEDYQIIGKEKHHFSDKEIVEKYMA